MIDLSKLRVKGTFREGAPSELEPFDPYHTIRTGRLAPHARASENIAFGAANRAELPSAVCLEVRGIVPDVRVRPKGDPICVGPGDDGFVQRQDPVR